MTYSASACIVRWRSMYVSETTHNTPEDDAGARPSAVYEASRAKHHAATSHRQYLTDHIRFITHQGKQILLLDLSNCSAAEVGKIFRAVPELVTTRPWGSVLILSDFREHPLTRRPFGL